MKRQGIANLSAAGLIVLAAVAAYHNSFAGPFIFDDLKSIPENRSIRRLWPIGPVLSPPCDGETVGGRPLLNITLAVNYALDGLNVRGYHATNLAIHIAAALLLFGILRRSFLLPALRDRFGRAATGLALASALLWMLDPLQTESVTYMVQRAESLCGLFYLLTLYCVIRGAAVGEHRDSEALPPCRPAATPRDGMPPARLPTARRLWYAAAVLACLLGMATKEVMATAPLVILLYDRTFLAGSFREAWRRRWALYAGLAATWVVLVCLLLSTGLIHRQSEMGSPDAWSYARSQPGVILYYLRLFAWPSRLCLCLSWMWPVANSFWEIFPGALAVTVLLTATAWAIFHGKACGFLGAWFFLILAPTSSVLAINGLMYEHRTYLSLAAAAVLVVTGGYAICERLLPRLLHNGRPATLARRAAAGALLTAVLIAMGWATAARNEDYRSMLAMWQGVVEEWPCHPLAHRGLGVSLADLGKTAEAVEQFHEVLRLDPRDGNAHQDLGLALADLGKTDEAIEQLHEALRVDPECAMARYNLGLILARSGKTGEAVAQFREAVRLKPDYAEAHAHLANALLMAGNTDEAIKHLRETLRLTAENAEAHNNLANLLVGRGENDAAIEHYTAALRLKPDYARAHNNLATLLAALGRSGQAIEHYREAVRLKPDYAAALNGLAWLLATRRPEDGGDPAVAVEMAERLQGLGGRENPRCLDTLAAAYAAAGRFPEAVATAEKALQLAESAGELPLARDIQLRLDLYRAGHAYRQPP